MLEKLIGKKLVRNIKINENQKVICQTILHFKFLTSHDRCVSLEINFGLFNAKKLTDCVTELWLKV